MHRSFRPLRAGPLLAGSLLVLSACAAGSTREAAQKVEPARGVTFGTIVSVRTMRQAQSAAGDPRAAILGAVRGGVTGPVPAEARSGAASEFIVRDDAGEPISVVQSDAVGLRVGERVVLTRGTRTRIARAGD